MKTNNNLNPKNFPDTRATYEAPVIEIVEVEVEHGFQMSLNRDPEDEPTY